MAFSRIVTIDDSKQIKKVMYDPEKNKLSVYFANKATYIYEGVSAELFGGLISAPSVGSYFAKYIRNHFTGQKLGNL